MLAIIGTNGLLIQGHVWLKQQLIHCSVLKATDRRVSKLGHWLYIIRHSFELKDACRRGEGAHVLVRRMTHAVHSLIACMPDSYRWWLEEYT